MITNNTSAPIDRQHPRFERPCDRVSLCVICHEPYLHFLQETLAKWDQTLIGKTWSKFLVLDGCDYEPPEGWRVMKGEWGHPSGPRNLVLNEATDGWIYYWDADNHPTAGLVAQVEAKRRLQSSEGVGVFYAGINTQQKGDSRDPRSRMFIDTGSLWRAEAVIHSGGWRLDAGVIEDWELSVRLKRMGWRIEPLGAKFYWHNHGENRSFGGRQVLVDSIFNNRSLGIVVPLRGDRDLLASMVQAMMSHELPPNCGVTLVNTAPDDDKFVDLLHDYTRVLGTKFERVSVVHSTQPDSELFSDIHMAVGAAYARGIAATPEDLILTWEDDVLPVSDGAFRMLIGDLRPAGPFDVAGALIPDRHTDNRIIAAKSQTHWDRCFNHGMARKMTSTERVGMLGGGFTLWTRPSLEKCPILGQVWVDQGTFPLGWDGFVFRRLNRAGFKIGLNPNVYCKHGGVELP